MLVSPPLPVSQRLRLNGSLDSWSTTKGKNFPLMPTPTQKMGLDGGAFRPWGPAKTPNLPFALKPKDYPSCHVVDQVIVNLNVVEGQRELGIADFTTLVRLLPKCLAMIRILYAAGLLLPALTLNDSRLH